MIKFITSVAFGVFLWISFWLSLVIGAVLFGLTSSNDG